MPSIIVDRCGHMALFKDRAHLFFASPASRGVLLDNLSGESSYFSLSPTRNRAA